MPFFRRKTSPPQGPVDTAIYAVGDIHGRCDLLDELLVQIRQDAARRARGRNLLVTLGDYVDRGADSRGVIERLSALPQSGCLPGFETVHLTGNHEDWLLNFLEDPGLGPLWFVNGGNATLESYGLSVGPNDDPDELRQRFRTALPASHLDFLRRLGVVQEEGDYLFVHAGVRPGVPIDRQEPHDLMWIRDPFLTSRKDHGKVIVHGHSISFEPEEFPDAENPRRIGIDTGAYRTDSLTCLVICGDERKWLRTSPGVWPA